MIFSIQGSARTARHADEVRAEGKIPAVVYGPEMQAVSVSVAQGEFEKLYSQAGESSLVDLNVDNGTPYRVLIQDVQYEPVKGKIIHVDFRQINMNKEMTATLSLNFLGESAAVKGLGGTLVKATDTVDIKCLPKDLVSHIDIDLSVLKTFDDIIKVTDLNLPAGITIVTNPTTVIAKVIPPLTEDELKAMEASDTMVKLDDIEVEKKGKVEKEGEEAADDAAPKEKAKE